MSEPILSVHDLGKTYWLYPTNAKRVLGCFFPPHRIPGAYPHNALEGLTFDLAPGEALGLIGKNGAGKSTALQLLTGIVKPTTGSFSLRGRVCALLELGSGFNPEFTGRDNIEISGSIYGLSPEQIKAEKEAIIEFSEIGDYIDQPVKFYSSGMFLRLAFAVALAGKPDLLIVDEALAVGDIFFRQKCYKRLYELREQGMAVLLVTHSMADVTEFCDRGLLLEHGRQVYLGETKEAILAYYSGIQNSTSTALVKQDGKNKIDNVCHSSFPWPKLQNAFFRLEKKQQVREDWAWIDQVCLTDSSDKPCSVLIQGDWLRIYIINITKRPIELASSGVTIFNDRGIVIYSKGTLNYSPILRQEPNLAPSFVYACHEIQLNIAPGEYSVLLGFSSVCESFYPYISTAGYKEWESNSVRLASHSQAVTFSVILPQRSENSRIRNFGLVDLPSKIEMISVPYKDEI